MTICLKPFQSRCRTCKLEAMSETTETEATTDWTPHEQRWRTCDGHMEREPGRLQLRVALDGREGVCSVLFEEDEESVTVLILVCGEEEPKTGWTDCPVHIYLDKPLGGRVVLDVVQGRREVPYVNVYEELKREFPELKVGGLSRTQPSRDALPDRGR